ncbi:MAG: FAD-dependent oxidoreductase [Candidatus Riflebacteria bacterium]|nr:FAD-dependent oxidoreductase [Candidatus Riflebacteria bacterium]
MSMPRKIRCTVESVVDHGERVYSVFLQPQSPVPAFKPGQFLHLTVDPFDPAGFWPESRVFSIASSPSDRKRLQVCYSVKGKYTTRMESVLAPGLEVWAKLPYGEFVIAPDRDVVLIAGGTGISAFTAFLGALTPAQARSVFLVYGARTPALHLFRAEILDRLAAVPAFQACFFAERDSAGEPGASPATASSDGPAGATGATPAAAPAAPRTAAPAAGRQPIALSGRIDLEAVWPLLPNPAASVFYLSGPPVMLTALSDQLKARGLPADQVRLDAWE